MILPSPSFILGCFKFFFPMLICHFLFSVTLHIWQALVCLGFFKASNYFYVSHWVLWTHSTIQPGKCGFGSLTCTVHYTNELFARCTKALWLLDAFVECECNLGTMKTVFLAAAVAMLERGEYTCFVWLKSWMHFRSIGNERLLSILICMFRSAIKFWLQKKDIYGHFLYIWWVNSSLLRTEMWKQNILQSKPLIYILCSHRRAFWGLCWLHIACLLVRHFKGTSILNMRLWCMFNFYYRF